MSNSAFTPATPDRIGDDRLLRCIEVVGDERPAARLDRFDVATETDVPWRQGAEGASTRVHRRYGLAVNPACNRHAVSCSVNHNDAHVVVMGVLKELLGSADAIAGGLAQAGLQLAVPTIDSGIDAIVFSTSGSFRAR